MVRLSIVIPTLNRPDSLARTLDRLERQTAGGFEVIVVSDPGERDPEAFRRALGERPYELRHLVRHDRSVSAARNTGWRDARAPLVLFLGDDILASPELVARHLERHERHPAAEAGVLGRVRWARELKVTAFMRWLDHGVQFDFENIEGEEAGWGRFYTSNVSVKRSLLETVDGFDEGFEFAYEDLDIGKRMAEHGFRLLYAPDAWAEHLHAVDLEDYGRRMATIAVSERRFAQKHPDFEPHFHRKLSEAAGWKPATGRLSRFAHLVPRGFPVLGKLVWTSAEVFFLQRLAPPFLEAWERAEREEKAAAASG